MDHEDRNEKALNRREFIKKAAVTGAVAWAVPVIQSVAATPAFAQTQCSPVCYHSPGSCGGCPNNCQSVCQAQCPPGTTGPGSTCGPICNACPNTCGADKCPPCYCVPSNYTCVDGGAPNHPCQCTFTCA